MIIRPLHTTVQLLGCGQFQDEPIGHDFVGERLKGNLCHDFNVVECMGIKIKIEP